MIRNPSDNASVIIDPGEFLTNIKDKMLEDISFEGSGVSPDAAVRTLDESRSITGPGEDDSDPVYEIILSIAKAEIAPQSYPYSGSQILELTIEVFCIQRFIGQDNYYRPLNDAFRILYWAQNAAVEGQLSPMAAEFSGGVDRGYFNDPITEPNVGAFEDISRLVYRTWWTVEFAYIPPVVDNLLPELDPYNDFDFDLFAGDRDNVHIVDDVSFGIGHEFWLGWSTDQLFTAEELTTFSDTGFVNIPDHEGDAYLGIAFTDGELYPTDLIITNLDNLVLANKISVFEQVDIDITKEDVHYNKLLRTSGPLPAHVFQDTILELGDEVR